MTIERKTIISQLEVSRDLTVQVRLALLLVDGAAELSSKYHRTTVPLGVPAELQMAAVNDHLALMGEMPLDESSIQRIAQLCALAQTWAE